MPKAQPPGGRLKRSAGTGFIEANNVVVNGNSFDITGTGPVLGGNGNSLVQ
jgi:hypothetical protein